MHAVNLENSVLLTEIIRIQEYNVFHYSHEKTSSLIQDKRGSYYLNTLRILFFNNNKFFIFSLYFPLEKINRCLTNIKQCLTNIFKM